jgi:hypothetical protein
MGKANAKNITAGVREAILIEFLRLEIRVANLGLVATVRKLNEAKMQFFAPPASPARRRGSDGRL